MKHHPVSSGLLQRPVSDAVMFPEQSFTMQSPSIPNFSAALNTSNSRPFLSLFILTQEFTIILKISTSLSGCTLLPSYAQFQEFLPVQLSMLEKLPHIHFMRPLLKIHLACDPYNREKNPKPKSWFAHSVHCCVSRCCITVNFLLLFSFSRYILCWWNIYQSSILVHISCLRSGRSLLLHFSCLLHLY